MGFFKRTFGRTSKTPEEMIREVKDSLRLSDIMTEYCPQVNLKPAGTHFTGFNPFRQDDHYGSFIVTDWKDFWYDFAVPEYQGIRFSGDKIAFVKLVLHVDYWEAACTIARDHGIIDSDDFAIFQKRKKPVQEKVEELKKIVPAKVAERPEEKELPPELLNTVYGTVKDLCVLKQEDGAYLSRTRHLTDSRIRRDYFSFPKNYSERKAVERKVVDTLLFEKNISLEDLTNVPGFYYEKESDSCRMSFSSGIGMLIHDAFGNIRGIQIRRYKVEEGQSRYVWMSSGFARQEPEKYEGGASARSNKDVVFPEGPSGTCLAITEGKFKAELLASYGSPAVSVQGVSTWRGVDEDIRDVAGLMHVRTICTYMDADAWEKKELRPQYVKLLRMLTKEFPQYDIYAAKWRGADGKGIDDLAFAGRGDTVQLYTAEQAVAMLDE